MDADGTVITAHFGPCLYSEEEPTMHLKLVDGVLHQKWIVKTFDADTTRIVDLDHDWRPIREEWTK